MVFCASLIVSLLQISVFATTIGPEGQGRLGESTFRRSCDWDGDFKGKHSISWGSATQHPLSSHNGEYNLLEAEPPRLEIIPLCISGSSDNRVYLVFFSDGYLASERSKFIEDATRLAEDVSKNQTFFAVKPLLNFWGAFTPSNESGIGAGGNPKDTVYGLFRPGTELRGVYYSKPEVARAACASMGLQCDYPILLGNDRFYGGLGGEFTTVTSSYLNGPLVLRHELGHSIIEVGEEYDGGFAYCGANAAQDPSDIPWKKWLSDAPVDGAAPRVERSIMPFQSYAWTMLDTSTSWVAEFHSSGTYSRFLVKFSLSGVPHKASFKVELDGVNLDWAPERSVGLDRWHYDLYRPDALSPGSHELKFTLADRFLEGTAQLCSVEVLEFGDESEFNTSTGHYSLYPTFSMHNETTYRPTDQDCLMRAVTTPNFCNACMETLWLNLLKRVRLIEGLSKRCTDQGQVVLDLQPLPLAHLRVHATHFAEQQNEAYTIVWKKDRKLLDRYTNMTSIILDLDDVVGIYTAEVKFSTDAVRVEDHKALTDRLEYRVSSVCPS